MAEEYTEISAEKLHETMFGIPPEKAEGKQAGTHTEVVIDDGRIEKIEEFQSPETLYEELIARVKKYHPSDDISLIEKAYQTAEAFHQGQVRKSGEPYIIHPLCVAIILADMEMDKETIVAGILHDVVEDTIMTSEEIKEQFGPDVELLVDGVTKLSQLQYSTDKLEMQAENLRKMFLAMAKDIRVIMIKLADRLHNMRTLDYMRPEKQQEKARETLDIYSPIANRLGISKLKVELDDLSLKYLEPEAYRDLVNQIAVRKSAREKYVQDIVDEVSVHIVNAGIKAKIDGRVKHFFSIYRKMKNQNKTIDQIYDLFAVRIIVDSVKDCYAALGVIHEIYRPIPGRFKDYIAVPKANMYQSLHTTLIGSGGVPFEIQIRTYEMHKTAEYGIAAHWKYKEASDGKKVEEQEEAKLTWLRQILEWQKDTSDNREFMGFLKQDLDLFSDQVYCFTPTGDVKNLPAGSTTVDFAYHIHTAVGNRMIGARVNGKLATIDYEIKNGDCIEILTSQNSKGPSRDWLNFVKSAHARNKINQWFKNEYKEENVIRGKDLIAAYCKTKSIVLSDLLKPEIMNEVMKKYGFKEWDSLMATVGHGALKEGQVINRLLEIYDSMYKEPVSNEQVMETIREAAVKKIVPASKGGGGIIVHGMNDIAARFSKCCNPLPGDEIVGFITRGRGVSIHRTDCPNVMKMPDIERTRLVEAEWAADAEGARGGKYMVEIIIYATNRSGLLADISKCMSDWDIDILSLSTKVNKEQNASINMAFDVSSREELNRVVEKLKTVRSVIDIDRTANS
ncbi:MAG: bifunctional (p)ppGpp synthetase/guanosine-3',5'-bis(diphosphate) 3'-pyrophosphohydrolase [Lachnospiraceae bacterium]|nr:bifunctional (p)ppGpp synthetase/guanosine-3',5'-bis(diphosphate) 3'-pyrophosphohydrolase [Lachnospiraceae bacterium]